MKPHSFITGHRILLMVSFSLVSIFSTEILAASVTMGPYRPTADSRVSKGSPTKNYGSSSTLQSDGSPVYESYLKFSVPAYNGTLVSAKLRIYAKDSTSNGPKVVLTNSAWTESGITYNTRPSLLSAALDDKASISSGKYVEYNVTSGISKAGEYSFAFLPTSTNGLEFSSKEGSRPPELVLVIESNSVPNPTPTPAPTVTPTPVPSPSPTVTPTPTPQPPAGSSDAFACLQTKTDVVKISGAYDRKFSPSTAVNRAFDARAATFLIKYDSHGMVTVDGSSSQTGMCWAGGFTYSDKPWDASWDDHKYGEPTRNSSVISSTSTGLLITGISFFNIHDGPRPSNSYNWRIEHVWGEYIRDDSVENDHYHSGVIYDSLFDGTYTGISTRPSSSSEDSDNGAGQVLVLEKVLLRLQAMPWAYKWDSKSGNIDEFGKPWNKTGIPYRHGSFFKYYDEDNSNGDRDTRNNHFVFKDVVLAAQHKNVGPDQFNFPAVKLIDRCENVTIAYLSDDGFVGHQSISDAMAAFPGCIRILQGQAARDFWKAKVTDWHARHPDVGAHRKPTNPGVVIFPQKF